ncbi:MAG: nucleotidyl transferase AbiEii/AbiGii toxin family protein [Deltaproteobacteria bacterium]|nr:nucleotidyl transferase AbiEii/AbiGii toxin family protein [Deltaproteobacteria bacterium]
MGVNRTDYNTEAVAAAKSVLIELVHLLGEYRDHFVVIGGWVPELLLPAATSPHVGSIDVDIALNHRKFAQDGYKMVQEILLSRGYELGKQPFIFFRPVKLGDRIIKVEVDLLAGEYGGTGKNHRTQKVQDVRPRKARGCDLAFELFREINVEGEIPGGGTDSVTVRVASIVPFLVMKGMALHDRIKEKDAWDIYYCVKNYPGGTDAVAAEFQPHLNHSLVREGLEKIAGKFSSVHAVGPKFVADFEEITDQAERELLQRDAFERVRALLEIIGVVKK